VSEPTPSGAETRSLATSTGLLLSGRIAGNAGFLVAVLVVARALGPSGRGALAFLTVTALVLARLTAVGVPSATIVFAAQRPARRPALLSNLLGFTVVASFAGGALVFGGLAVVEQARPVEIDTVVLVSFVLATVLAAVVEAGYSFLLGCSRFRAQASVTAVAPWLYAALLLALELGPGLTVNLAAYAWIVANAVWAALLVGASGRGIGLGRPDRPLLWESVRFGVRAWVGGLARFLNFRVDQILMAYLASSAALGVYAVSVNASETLLYLPGAVATAFIPSLARTEPAGRSEHTLRVFRLTGLLTIATIVVAAVLGPLLIPLAFGEDFRGSVVPFLLLLPGALGFAALRVFSGALVASGLPGRSSLGPAVALAAGVVLDLALIPPFGAEGAAAAATVAFLAGGAAAAAAYGRVEGFPARALVPRADDVRELRAVARTRLAAAFAARTRETP
jgi:O-antigen/teichoic acid export membrane protein